MHYIPGALHMHTIYSDGTGTVEDLARAARKAGLRWIIVTDHDTLAGKPYEGWVDGVLVIVGHEITPDRNHFLALNVDEVIPNTLPPQEFVDQVYARGGFGIIAHPDERVKNDFKDIYRWDDWSVDGPRERAGRPAGIELWNHLSDWGEHLTERNKELLYFMPHLGLNGPTRDTLAWWDRLNVSGKRTFGVGGVDAHAFKKKAPWGEIEIFSYRSTFGTVTNYLLLHQPLAADARAATNQVYGALAEGRSYFLNRRDGDCAKLTFQTLRGQERLEIGTSPSLRDGPLALLADVGRAAELRLVRDGHQVATGDKSLRYEVREPGVYRLEARRNRRAWLFTNPIYVQP
jgi:hypothetical protein